MRGTGNYLRRVGPWIPAVFQILFCLQILSSGL